MIYRYARVSTVAQGLASQFAQLKAAGCEKVFREKIIGTTAGRPQLRKLRRFCSEMDGHNGRNGRNAVITIVCHIIPDLSIWNAEFKPRQRRSMLQKWER